jgi:hypothetical protein
MTAQPTLEQLNDQLVAAQAQIDELRNRMRELDVARDIVEIKQLTIRYIDAIALGKYEGILDLFTDEAVLDLSKPNQPQDTNPPLYLEGKDKLRDFYENVLSKGHTGTDGFFVVNPLITVDGDRAAGTWHLYIMYRYPRTGQSMFWIQSLFAPEYVRETDGWKFSAIHCQERLGIPGGDMPVDLISSGV